MPGEMINPLYPQLALGNLCECGSRLPLPHSRPKPFSGERAPRPQLESAAWVGAAGACGAPRQPGAWVEDAAASPGGQCTRAPAPPGPWGRLEPHVRISTCRDVVLAFGRLLTSKA